MHSPLTLRKAVAAWGDWYVSMGVVDCVEPEGTRRTVVEPATSTPAPMPSLPRAPAAVAGSGANASAARELARRCASLEDLEVALRGFKGCALAETATQLCFADGNRAARVMLVGEAPGAEEDRQGRPFVGPSGRLLDRMLAAIGLARSDVYITNLIYWRPPGNRSPTSAELALCLPFLERQIELLRPVILVSVGGVAARLLLDLKDGVSRTRGRQFLYQPPAGGEAIRTLVMLHPAYLLRQPLHKRLAWRDMLHLRREMHAQGIWPASLQGKHTTLPIKPD